MNEPLVHFRSLYAVIFCFAILLGCIVRATPSGPRFINPYENLSVGYDVSWPNCGATPPKGPTWGIVGVTGGLSFRPNRCALLESSWFLAPVSLYANTGYPGRLLSLKYAHTPRVCNQYDAVCVAYDYGYAEGLYAVQQAARQGLHATLWWLDVESDNSWDIVATVNRSSIQGTIDAIRAQTLVAQVGMYAYPGQWDVITDHWHPKVPAWAATGSDDPEVAKQTCAGPSFTGGPLWLAQYTVGLDRNLVCRQ